MLLTGGIAKVFGHSKRTGASNSDTLTVCGSQIDVQFRPGPLDPDRQEVIDWGTGLRRIYCNILR